MDTQAELIRSQIIGQAVAMRAAKRTLDELAKRPAPAYRRRQLMRTVAQAEREMDVLVDRLEAHYATLEKDGSA